MNLHKASKRSLESFERIAERSGLSHECSHEACSDEEVTADVYFGFRKYNKCTVGW